MAPAYMIGSYFNANQIAVFAFMSLVSLASVMVLFAIQKAIGIPSWAAWFSSFAYLFGTTAFPYAVTIAQHNATVLCMLLMLLAGIQGTRKPWLYVFGWLAYGLAIFMDYPNLLLLLPAAVYMGLSSATVIKDKQSSTIRIKLAVFYCVYFL